MDLAELLRGREATPVSALAAELGVSRRTLLRDLAALRERGMPISGEPGHGGGVRLEGERGLTAVHMSLDEVVALWLGARLSRAASDLPWGGASSTAMTKLLGSMPKARARALRALCGRVVVGTPASANVRAEAGAPPVELLSRFEEAFTSGRLADGTLTGAERGYIDRFLAAHGMEPLTPQELRPWRPHELGPLRDRELAEATLQAAVELMHLDAVRDGSELRIVRTYARVWGVDEAKITAWDRHYDRHYAPPMSSVWRALSRWVR